MYIKATNSQSQTQQLWSEILLTDYLQLVLDY